MGTGRKLAFSLTPTEGIEESDGSLTASNESPWFEIRFIHGPPAAQWIMLRYDASLLDRLCRPLLRLETREAATEIPMPAPLFGCAEWTGWIPANTIRLSISPTVFQGPFGFRLELCRPLSLAEVLWNAFWKSPLATISAIGLAMAGGMPAARSSLQRQLASWDIDRYHVWKEKLARPMDLRGLEALRRPVSLVHIRLVLVTNHATTSADLDATLASLDDQQYSNWSLCIVADDDKWKKKFTRLVPGGAKQIAFAASLSELWSDLPVDQSIVVWPLALGDCLPDYALRVLAEHVGAFPNDDVIYGDEDVGDEWGRFSNPKLKPDWSPVFHTASGYAGDALFVRPRFLTDIDSSVRCGDLGRMPWLLNDFLKSETPNVGHIRRVMLTKRSGLKVAVDASARRESGRDLIEANGEICVTIIIPTRDKAGLLKRCLDSVDLTKPLNFEIIIVDNDSVEVDTHQIFESRSRDSRTRILKVPGPFNFSNLCNRAAEISTARTLVFLNNDTVVLSDDWLLQLLSWTAQPEIGAVGARLLYPSGRLQHIGLVMGLNRHAGHIDRNLLDKNTYLQRALFPHEVSAVTGACLAVERDKFQSIGGFDEEQFPVELNDIDLCLRLASAGWKTLFVPDPTLVHVESATRGMAKGRYEFEQSNFRRRWSKVIRDDPYFHPALSLQSTRTRLG